MKSIRPSVFAVCSLSVAVFAGLLATVGGCRTSGVVATSAPTRVDLLVRAYPDLESGRFVTIADFEDPVQMELFQLVRATGASAIVLSREGGRKETGPGCLKFTVGSSGDALVISDARASQWHLTRDWSNYDLALMSIYSPASGLTAELSITAGPDTERFSTSTSIALTEGWNLARLDLAEVGERLPLDDVREIRITISGNSKTVQLALDDIILTGNRKNLLGDSHNRASGLYVQRTGRRWKIGAGWPGDFELTFANGQIVEWYNVAADPQRLRNLVWGTALGPNPVVIDGSEPDNEISIRSRIVEMNSVRVVVASEWRIVDDTGRDQSDLGRKPFKRWVYTIYATGQVYVSVEATTKSALWPASKLGLAVTLAASPGGELQTRMNARVGEAQNELRPTFATARIRSSDAFLLFVVDDAGRPMRITKSVPGGGNATASTDQTSFVVEGPPAAGEVETWSCHLFLGSASKIADAEASARAIAYASPVLPRLEQGSFVSADGDQSGNRGFDPASGCYLIAPDRGSVRFIIDGTEQPWFSPAFQITNPGGQDARVYVDHLIFDRVAHDARGNVILQLPGVIRKPVMVEVLFSRQGASGVP